MSGISKKLMGTTAAGGGFTAIEDVFSTYLYTGTGATQTITNGIDLAGEGGLVWIKARGVTSNHSLNDSERSSFFNSLRSNLTSAQSTGFPTSLSATSVGFDVPNNDHNVTGRDYASWTFRKAPRFFDVVTYTGTGAAQTIAHNLGTDVGTIIVKRTDSTSDWSVWHRSYGGSGGVLNLNENWAGFTGQNHWNSTLPTSTEFSLGAVNAVNTSGGTYVAYLFAHDPLGPTGDGSDGLIACGSYTGNGLADGPDIDLGWEPQWILVKRATGGISFWGIYDTMRGIVTGINGTGQAEVLYANLSDAADQNLNRLIVTPTGFSVIDADSAVNASGSTYIYIAIRRGPMRAPESGTEVFATTQWVGDSVDGRVIDTSITLDASILTARGEAWDRFSNTRLTGNNSLLTNSTAAQATQGIQDFGKGQTEVSLYSSFANFGSRDYILWGLKRAPNFFDVVAYAGNGVAGRTVPHNLGVAPELVMVKLRNGALGWATYSAPTGAASKGFLNDAGAFSSDAGSYWNLTTPTDNEITLGSVFDVNGATGIYVAYLFATLAGVSKVGSYTGNGSSQTINCGFTSGARFILIKRTDSTGDWYVWDTARGIVAANDPHLSLNTTAAEVTTDDSIDPDSSGFIVNQVAATNINVSAASYIFYAVA